MSGNFVQLLVILIAVGAPVFSWIFGKLREQHELKKARDAARMRQQEALRTTQLTDRSKPPQTPQERRAQQRTDLAARRQAQLRELRERQHQRAPGPGKIVARGPAQGGTPLRPTPPRPSGPLRPGVPPPASQRPRPATAPPRPVPVIPPRRPVTAPPRIRAPQPRPQPTIRRREEPTPPKRRSAIAATEIGKGRAVAALRGPTGVGPDVRAMLKQPDGRPRPRADLAKAIALTEVLGTPLSLRKRHELPWHRV